MNTQDIVIKIAGVGKKYQIGEKEKYLTLRDTLTHLFHKKPTAPTIWALKDISLEVKKGEVLGIIGNNGAGKSTLLKILSRITDPTVGTAEIHGRVASLLEVGTGFNLELTGRENIYLNGAILGMTKKEINSKFSEIVDFAGINKFIDTPVKHYSSGMYMRLAFAVAANLNSEILIIDEVLAVGDAEFQKKCLGKMNELASSGRTVIFVSHNIPAVQNLCDRVIVMDKGKIVATGKTIPMIKKYLGLNQVGAGKIVLSDPHLNRSGSGKAQFTSIRYLNHDEQVSAFLSGENSTIELSYASKEPEMLKNVDISLGFDDEIGIRLFALSTELTGETFSQLDPTGKIQVHIPKLPLNAGTYTLTLFMRVNGEISDWLIGVCQLIVEKGDYYGTGKIYEGQGSMLIEHRFNS